MVHNQPHTAESKAKMSAAHRALNRKRPASVRQLSDVEAAWLGALVEGEGYVGVYSQGNHQRVALKIGVTNSEVELISACLRLAGVGTVHLRKRREDALGARPIWQWEVQRYNDVCVLAEQLAPYCLKVRQIMGVKRDEGD